MKFTKEEYLHYKVLCNIAYIHVNTMIKGKNEKLNSFVLLVSSYMICKNT